MWGWMRWKPERSLLENESSCNIGRRPWKKNEGRNPEADAEGNGSADVELGDSCL